jgi:SAM-dependent methyltransferase
MVGMTRPLPAVLEAHRTGGGVPYHEYGEDMREGIAYANRPMFVNLMGSEWLPAVPDVHERLQADPPARVADVGCGTGWSSISIARAYPEVRVDGFDLDEDSIAEAKANAEAEGLTDRVSFQVRDAADPELSGRYDVAIAVECIHDMSRPVEALRAMRSMAGEDGAVLVVDERVGEAFTAPPTECVEVSLQGRVTVFYLSLEVILKRPPAWRISAQPARSQTWRLPASCPSM